METVVRKTNKRVLDPVDRLSEIVFGLVMVLSFTCSLSAATAGREEVRTILVAAIGCNAAWGIVDGIMYVWTSLIERARAARVATAIRESRDPASARALIEEEVPPAVARALDERAVERIREIMAGADPPPRARVTRHDLRAFVAVFLMVFLSTFPVVIPFFFAKETRPAMRLSNAVAIGLLYMLGHKLGSYAGLTPWRMGLGMVGIGIVLVAITLALGG